MQQSIQRILGITAGMLALSTPAFAGEFGVRNEYNHSSRWGHGTQTVDQNIKSNRYENGKSVAVKVVESSFKDGNGYKDHSKSVTANTGTSHFNESAKVKVNSTEYFNTESGSFGHSTSSFFQ